MTPLTARLGNDDMAPQTTLAVLLTLAPLALFLAGITVLTRPARAKATA